MIDEGFDRNYQEARLELNAGIARLLVRIGRAAAQLLRRASHSRPPAHQEIIDANSIACARPVRFGADGR
jgi:hypothetical protein